MYDRILLLGNIPLKHSQNMKKKETIPFHDQVLAKFNLEKNLSSLCEILCEILSVIFGFIL